MLNRLRYSSSSAFLRFILCAVISLTVFVGNSIVSNASASTSWTWCFSTSVDSYNRTYQINCGIDEAIYNPSTGVIYFYQGGTDTITVDTGPIIQTELSAYNYLSYDMARLKMYPMVNFVLNSSSVVSSASNAPTIYTDIRPYALIYGEKFYLDNYAYNDIVIDVLSDSLLISFGCELDVQMANHALITSQSTTANIYESTWTLSSSSFDINYIGGTHISSGEQAIVSEISYQNSWLGGKLDSVVAKLSSILTEMSYQTTRIIDRLGSITSGNTVVVEQIQDQTDQQNQNAQAQIEATEKQNALQESANELQEEANETSKGIFDKITDFFNGFFENITYTASGLFIPEDGYFEDFFVRMNDFFAEKLGALYAPIDMFVTIMNGILNADSVTPGIPFPGVKWEDTYIIEPTTVSFDTFYEQFPDLQEKIYFATDVILVGSVIWLLQVKLKEVMTN